MAELHVAGTGSCGVAGVVYARAAGHDVVALLELVDQSRIGSEVHGLPVVGLEAEPGAAVIGLGGDRLAVWSRLAEHGWRGERMLRAGVRIELLDQITYDYYPSSL